MGDSPSGEDWRQHIFAAVLSRTSLQLNYTLMKRFVHCSFFLYEWDDLMDAAVDPAHRMEGYGSSRPGSRQCFDDDPALAAGVDAGHSV